MEENKDNPESEKKPEENKEVPEQKQDVKPEENKVISEPGQTPDIKAEEKKDVPATEHKQEIKPEEIKATAAEEKKGLPVHEQIIEIKAQEKEEKKTTGQYKSEKDINREIRRRTLKALAIWGVTAIVAPIAAVEWINKQTDSNGLPAPLRKALNLNEKLFKNFVTDKHWVKTYPKEAAIKNPRTNGQYGLSQPADLSGYTIQVLNLNNPPLNISMDEIYALPKHEIIFSFKCIEGWDMITYWGGALFSDFVAKYKLATHSGNAFDKSNPDDIVNFAGLETPDGEYYVGLDIASVLHPQTLLCYEMNGEPLPQEHGAPLRLITPTKYGIKNIKRIGKIVFSDIRPHDYWFEQGYDYFAGL